MWFLLRAALVIGVITYLASPADEGTGRPPDPSAWAEAARRGPSGLAEAERLWRSLPPGARQALLDRARAEAAALAGSGPAQPDGKPRS